MTDTPIADYALLSDCRSAALVSRAGSVDWLCFPRFDSPSVFGRILDPDAGHWSIRIAGDPDVRRRYRDGSLVLETTFAGPAGEATLVDAMATGPNPGGHDLARDADHLLLRRIACSRGQVEVEVEYGPVTEYGLVFPVLAAADGGLLGRGGADVLALSSPVPLDVRFAEAVGRFTLREGEAAGFAMHWRPSWKEPPRILSQDDVARMLEETTEAWAAWSSSHQSYEGPWRDLVYGSGTVLQGLTYQPTGAIVAAPTTSLPEEAGGVRNWDYRYAWLRDASLTHEALWVAACPDESDRFFSWMAGAAASRFHAGADLQIMFGVGGEHDLTEREVLNLTGWRRSLPVRVGNAAWRQPQLDVYGEVLAAAHRLRERLDLDPVTRHFLRDAADAAADRWEEQDHGIWEMRGEPRDFLHSKVMCWVALERAADMAGILDAEDDADRWREARDRVRAAILERGWSERAGAFTQSFGSDELDASALVMPIVGFLPADDPRMWATIEAIGDRLSDERGLIYRYRAPDGLPGGEGTFLLCTFWLAHALALAGKPGRAREVFERAVAHVNDVGLLAEEVDPSTGEQLGNFPQAFSHVGLVTAAWAITQAERRSGDDPAGSARKATA